MKHIKIHSGKAYIVLQKYPITKFEDGNVLNMDKVKVMRDWLGADHVLRDNTHFLFCEPI